MDETLRNELREDTRRLEVLSAWADARHAESKKEMKACLEEVIEIANRLNDAWWRETSVSDANKALALLEKGKNPFNLSCARGCRHCKTVSRESAQGWCAFREAHFP